MGDQATSRNGAPMVVRDGEPRVYDVPGLRHETLAGPGQGMRGFEVWRQRVAPGAGTPRHKHDCEEVFVILEGAGTLELEDGPRPFVAGSTVIVPPNVLHRVANSGSADLLYLAVLGMTPVALQSAEGRPVHRPWLGEVPPPGPPK